MPPAVGRTKPSRGGKAATCSRVATVALIVSAALGTVPSQLEAQSLTVGIGANRTTYDEAVATNRQSGFGGSGFVQYAGDGWAVEGGATWLGLSASEEERESITMLGSWARGRRVVWQSLAAEVGFESRAVDPQFSAQDVGLVTAGLRYESTLTSLARMWVRGAAVPLSRFNGGGRGGVGMEIGFGVVTGPADGKLRGVVGYRFQRVDRTVSGIDVPMQLSGVTVGVQYGLR